MEKDRPIAATRGDMRRDVPQGPASTGAEWRRGWPLVVAAMLGIGTGPGLFQNLSSLFTPGIIAEFGWTRGEIATASGIGLIGGLLAPFLGRIVDRIGARPMIVAAMVLLGAAYCGLAAMTGALWQYQLLVLGLTLAVPGTSGVVYGRLIADRFVAHRGIAMGVATSGISLTTLAFPPLLGLIVASQGWRGGAVALAILTTGIALPLVLVLIRGVPAGGTRADPDAATAALPAAGFTAQEARRDGRFWRLGACAAAINIATIGFVTQLVPFGLDGGLSPAQAALLLVSFGASQVVGRLAIGVLVDRFRPQRMAAAAAILSAAAFAGLQIDQPGFAAMMALVFLAGLMSGAEADLLPFMAARLFGVRAFGELYGTLLAIALLGTAGGIVGFGLLYDETGGYAVALASASVALVIAGVLFLTLHDRPLPEAQAAAHG